MALAQQGRARASGRRGDWFATFTGRRFFPLDPRPEDVCIHDIAHALGQIARYGGHARAFYSVAEHSIHVSHAFADPETALEGLLHDSAEAYLGDIQRPLKPDLAGYKEIERRVEAAIWTALGCGPPRAEVKEADDAIVVDEIDQAMPPIDWGRRGERGLGVVLEFWAPPLAEALFLKRYFELRYALAADGG